MRLFAFQGLHYARPAAEIDPLVAPPYDQIDEGLRAALHARSPHQFTHLTMPVAGDGGDAYGESARLHAEWLADGTIARDAEPCLYPYAIRLAAGGQRLGLCCLAGLEDPAAGVVRPHEATLDKPLADRVALLKANRVDLEPILFLSEDAGRLDELLKEDSAGSPIAEHVDPDGHRHLVFRLSDSGRIARYRELLAPLPVAIADGHHRYKTARQFAAEEGITSGPAAAKMTVVTSLASPGLTIDPIHRALTEELDLDALASFATARRKVTVTSGRAFAAEVAAAASPALGIWPAVGSPEVWQLDPAKAPDSVPAGARDLSVALLHGLLLARAGYPPAAATDGTILYRSSPDALASELADGEIAVGLLLPPMSPEAFAAAIADGDLLPPKSTRFLPKVMSGLVWTDHRAEIA